LVDATDAGSSSSDDGLMSVEEIQKRAAQYRAEKKKTGLVEVRIRTVSNVFRMLLSHDIHNQLLPVLSCSYE
jgi:hypothetical protein